MATHTDITYLTDFMDVISINKTGENFHFGSVTIVIFAVHCITPEVAKYKLCKVKRSLCTKGIFIWWPMMLAHPLPNPLAKVNDTIQIDGETGKITDLSLTLVTCAVTGGVESGKNWCDYQTVETSDSFDVLHMKDANGNSFATWLSNIFIIGKDNKWWLSVPCGKGHSPYCCWGETGDWQPNRAVDKMISTWCD